MERSWKYRRVMTYIIVFACLGMIFAALVIGGNDLVVLAVVNGAFLTIAGVAGAYLGVAAWDDRNKAKEILDGIAEKGEG
ncbi:hypothetical protein M8R20_16535 [Pseudomonas sp. R2.Fl]|nr:hypothetical protein [Pseudomonas sp. R2.Fl]